MRVRWLNKRGGAKFGQATFALLAERQVPSVAVIHGYVFGGGLELALACTFRVAMPKAKMGLLKIKLGLTPGYGGTQRLPRLIGEARAWEFIFSGRTTGAEEALQVGLVNRIAEAGSPTEIGKAYLISLRHAVSPSPGYGSSHCARIYDSMLILPCLIRAPELQQRKT